MKAFTDTPVTSEQLLASLAAHRKAGNLVQRIYWNQGRGCGIGCSIHDFSPGNESSHDTYQELFGIPYVLARLQDAIFEGLPYEDAEKWPERFVRAIVDGTDLTPVTDRWTLWLLTDPDSPMKPWQDNPQIAGVAELYDKKVQGRHVSETDWRERETAATPPRPTSTQQVQAAAQESPALREAKRGISARYITSTATCAARAAGLETAERETAGQETPDNRDAPATPEAAEHAAYQAMAQALLRTMVKEATDQELARAAPATATP